MDNGISNLYVNHSTHHWWLERIQAMLFLDFTMWDWYFLFLYGYCRRFVLMWHNIDVRRLCRDDYYCDVEQELTILNYIWEDCERG